MEEELLSILPDANYKYSPHPIYSIFMDAPAQDEAKKQLKISAKNVLMFFGLIREYKGLDIGNAAIKDDTLLFWSYFPDNTLILFAVPVFPPT